MNQISFQKRGIIMDASACVRSRASGGIVIRFLIFILIFALITLGSRCFFQLLLDRIPVLFSDVSVTDSEQNDALPKRIVILDAGHGGEDGGTSASDGTLEKDLNLSMAFLLAEYLRAGGVTVILTRDSDRLLYDVNSDYAGKKKLLDQRARLLIAETAATEHPEAEVLFVSIHMNSYPKSTVRGFQVWYSDNHADSVRLANAVQASSGLFSENTKGVKHDGGHIFLLDRLEIPAILIECGFLSCPEEAMLLKSEEYRQKMAFSVFTAIMNYGASEE